jgi:DNA helicase HerA-like ATPase
MAQSAIGFPKTGVGIDGERTIVFGQSGSGKTIFSLWLLSTRNFHQMPWIIVDYKGDKNIRKIEELGANEIRIDKSPPTKPGLYIVRPDVEEPRQMNDFLLRSWENEETGLYFDEGFMVPQNRPYKAFDHIMNQGRSRNVPVIACYQRSSWLSQFAMANASYFAIFRMKKPEDRDTLTGYISEDMPASNMSIHTRLPKHYCLWYEDDEDRLTILKPSPGPDHVLETFRQRLVKKKGMFD